MTAVYQARYKERCLAKDPEGWRASERQHHATFRARYPEKKAAWNAVYQAVRSGRLVRPAACERCGVSCKPQASHDDYSKRLDVEWLCQPCHTAKDFHSESEN